VEMNKAEEIAAATAADDVLIMISSSEKPNSPNEASLENCRIKQHRMMSPRGLGQRRCHIVFRIGVVVPITFYVPFTFRIVMRRTST